VIDLLLWYKHIQTLYSRCICVIHNTWKYPLRVGPFSLFFRKREKISNVKKSSASRKNRSQRSQHAEMQIKSWECVLSHDQQICVMSHVYTEKMSNVKGHQQQENRSRRSQHAEMQIKSWECVLSHDKQVCVMSHVYTDKIITNKWLYWYTDMFTYKQTVLPFGCLATMRL
jgi:hypothetical protein